MQIYANWSHSDVDTTLIESSGHQNLKLQNGIRSSIYLQLPQARVQDMPCLLIITAFQIHLTTSRRHFGSSAASD